MSALPALFVGHGAPTFALDPGAAGAALAAAPDRWPRPRAVLSVSAHWNSSVPRLGGAARPETVHDFWGFPQPLYDLQYPAPGDPDLARRAAELLGQAGLSADIAPHRGLDHAVWIPLRLMYPGAEVPVVPMSIQSRLGPEHHLHLGQVLAPLLTQGVLLVASGNLTHNLGHWHQAGQVSLRLRNGLQQLAPRTGWRPVMRTHCSTIVGWRPAPGTRTRRRSICCPCMLPSVLPGPPSVQSPCIEA